MKYLLRKGGYYYRPASSGYTEKIASAGIFNEGYALSHAESCEEVTAIPVTEITKDTIEELRESVNNSMRVLTAICDSVTQLDTTREY